MLFIDRLIYKKGLPTEYALCCEALGLTDEAANIRREFNLGRSEVPTRGFQTALPSGDALSQLSPANHAGCLPNMRIPNRLHFVFGLREDFGGKPFCLAHYLSIKSATEANGWDDVWFHCRYEPKGVYWDRIKPFLKMMPVGPEETALGGKLKHHAHKTDYLRLKILQEHGGIYLDIDTISKKPLTPFLDHECVLGEELGVGLCNGVILARAGAPFLEKWLEHFHEDHLQTWNYHAVVLPKLLQERFPDLVQVLPHDAFHHPLWTEPEKLFEECADYPNAYVHHLWESVTWDPYLSKLTEENIRSKDTTYNLVARRFL